MLIFITYVNKSGKSAFLLQYISALNLYNNPVYILKQKLIKIQYMHIVYFYFIGNCI